MGYMYRVYEEGKGGFRPYVPKNFSEDNANELLYFDYLTCLAGDPEVFYAKMVKDDKRLAGLNISKVTIGLREAESFFEYKPIYDNPYIEEILKVEKKTFVYLKANKNSSKKTDKMTIVVESRPFASMKDYILGYLNDKDRSELFFRRIFRSKNSFSELLRRYSITYLTHEGTNEDMMEVSRLEREIENNLKEYKNFRAIAKARYEYEIKLTKADKRVREKEERLKADVREYNDDYDGEEQEEFLDEREYEEMAGEGNKLLITRGR